MTKIQSIILLIFLTCNGQALAAWKDEPTTNPANPGFFKKITPEFLYSYIDFNFNSSNPINYNHYYGHSNIYSAGGDHAYLNKKLIAGLYFFRIDTVVNSQFLLQPSPAASSSQTLNNNTIFGHVLTELTPQFYVDLAGGYGFDKASVITSFAQSGSEVLIAQANNSYNNWFASANALYRKVWKKVLLKTNVGALYSQINTPSYPYLFPSSSSFQPVPSLVNKATLVLENAELGYTVNDKILPFINGGLIQVVQFSNSRPLIFAPINGSLPQLNMNKNGYRLGAGVTFKNKNVSIRLEEKYYNAGGTFQSYQTIAGLEYEFN